MNTPVKLFLGALIGAHCMTAAAISFNVTFDDPSGRYSTHYSDIISHTNAAGDAWNTYLGSDANLDVRIGFSNIATADGHSATSAYVGNNGPSWVYEQGAAAELRTGIDPNGDAPDIYISFGRDYLLNDLWFDPDPYSRSAVVPTDKIDAESVFLHELGHAFAFNGWRDPIDGSLPGNYQSTFDALVIAEGNNLFFIGEGAMREYGDKVPLTFGNYAHLGNRDSQSSPELVSDLMNGVAFNYGDRAFISSLDLAILADTGVIDLPLSMHIDLPTDRSLTGGPVTAPAVSAVPVPATAWLFASGLCGLIGLSRSKKPNLAG
ncbi:MAG: hypothetical protein ACR2PS_06250 [Pseudomonadales bacterium]